MNIASVNLVPRPPGNKAIERDGLCLPENGVVPEDFANALKGQEKLLSGTNGQAELPGQSQAIDQPDTSGLLESTDGQNGLAALLENYLPLSNAEKEHGPAGIAAALLASADGQVAIAPSIPPADVTAIQDMGSAMAAAGLAAVRLVPEGAGLNVAGANRAPDVSVQKETVLGQPIQNDGGLNLQPVDNAGPVKQALTPLIGLEQAAPQLTAEMPATQKPADNRAESLALTKPLAHPGWGKDLGEQIIWMNNKEISAAEIKLNPVHLGPISIRIDVSQDNQTSILFTAQHAETKEAIEASIPKLREMLLGQQLNLVNANVSQNSNPNNGRPQSQPFYGAPGNHGPNLESIADASETSEPGQAVSKGLLSLYA
jgi:flagellar hook-length control protein FliK